MLNHITSILFSVMIAMAYCTLLIAVAHHDLNAGYAMSSEELKHIIVFSLSLSVLIGSWLTYTLRR